MSSTLPKHPSDEHAVHSIGFNQDFSSLVVGLHSGYSFIPTLDDEYTEQFHPMSEPILMVERLFLSNLLILVSSCNKKKLMVYHCRRKTQICHYKYSHTILATKMNRERLVVCVEDGIFIHNVRDMMMLHKVEETPPNHKGVLALSPNEGRCYLAYPGSHRMGTVYVFDALSLKNVATIGAHDSQLAALEFNSDGSLLASASEKGTVIRVFLLPTGDKVAEFRRGLARCATISCLSFSLDGQFLTVASNTETIHVFKVELRSRDESSDASDRRHSVSSSDDIGVAEGATGGSTPPVSGSSWTSGWRDWMGSALRTTSAYLPVQVSEVFTQDRAWVHARLTYPGGAKVAAIVQTKNGLRLLVASLAECQLFVFTFDPSVGGAATLLKTVSLLASDPSSSPESGSPESGAAACGGGPHVCSQQPPGTDCCQPSSPFDLPRAEMRSGSSGSPLPSSPLPPLPPPLPHLSTGSPGSPLANTSMTSTKSGGGGAGISYAQLVGGNSPLMSFASTDKHQQQQLASPVATGQPTGQQPRTPPCHQFDGDMDPITGTIGSLRLHDDSEFPPVSTTSARS